MKKAIVGTTFLSAAFVDGFTLNGQNTAQFRPIQSRSLSSNNLLFPNKVQQVCEYNRLTANVLAESISESEVQASNEEEAPQNTVDLPQLTIDDIVVGQEYTGVVKNTVTYGAFVDIGVGINGLVHVSQLSDSYVRQASEVVSDGEVVKVKVLDIESDKLVLSMRKNPRAATQQRGDVSKYTSISNEDFIDGKVEDIVPYGAFVRLDEDVVGFVHISQLKVERVENVEDVVSKGEEVKVRILEVDEDKRRISLSLLSADAKIPAEKKRQDVSPLANYDPNEFVEAEVKSIKDYGVFLEFEGVQGLLHISKIQDFHLQADELTNMFKVGEKTSVRLMKVDVEENKVYFSKQGSAANFADFDPEEEITVKITSIPEFGIFADIGYGFEALLHKSELPEYVDDLSSKYSVGDEIKVRIIKVDVESNAVRLSMREPGAENQRTRAPKDVSKFADFNPEEFIPGKVVSITNYGAFVNIAENLDGMVHISQLSTQNVESVEDVLSIGDEVQVRITECDVENNKLELSLLPPPVKRAPNADVSAFVDAKPQEFIAGKVSGIIRSGAFVTIAEGIDGFCHISQIGSKRVEDVNDVLEVGQDVQVRVVSADTDRNKVELSMRPYRANKSSFGFEDDMGLEESANEPDWKKFVAGDDFNTSIN